MKLYLFLILLAFVFISFVLGETALSAEQSEHEHSDDISFSLFSLVKPLGIATICFVCATFATGLFRRTIRRSFLKVHLAFAIISVILGLAHGILVFVLFG